MRSVCDAFWPSELPGLMSVGRRALGLTEQARLAERSRAQIDRCRAIQKLGVNARAKKRQDRTKYICDQQNRLPEHLMAKERDRELIEQLKLHDRECCDKSDSALKSIVHRALGLKK